MNPSTLFFYFAEDQICFAVESRSSGYTKDKGKKLYHLNPDDEAVRKLLRYVKYKFWTEKISEKNTPKIIAIGDTNTPNSFFFRLEFEGYMVDFTPDKFTEQQEKKEMKVVTAEDISRIFTELEEKYGKDKAIGIFVGKTQESVRLIDGKSAAQILFEKLQEHQNKEENKTMMRITCCYKAHTVDITKDSVGYHCPIIDNVNGDFTFNDHSLENLVKKFKNFVDKKDRIEDNCIYNMSLEVTYKDETLSINSYNPHTAALVKRYIADANFSPKAGTLSLDKFVDQFVDYVDKKEESKMSNRVAERLKKIDKQITDLLEEQAKLNYEGEMTQDKDVEMVNNFVATIKAVIEEMKSVEETPLLPMIRDLKLKGVYDLYKDILPVALDQYKGIYDFLLTQEPKKEEKPENKTVTHLMTQLDRLAQKDFTPFELRGQLIEIYHLFGKILGLTLEDIHKYYFERAEK